MNLETQTMKSIPLSTPCLTGNEWEYVRECLDTGWVSSAGSYVDRFEERVCEYTGAAYAVACVNGTAALHIALMTAGIGADDEVIVPTLTFIATVNTVHYVGAHPVFLGSDEYYNLDPSLVTEFIESKTEMKDGFCVNKMTGRKIAAIIPVHILGNAVNLEPMLQLCRQRNIQVIEDAAESLGTSYCQGSLSGSHTGVIGRTGVYSFNGNKIITSGGGGMLVTNDAEIASRARYLTNQAKESADGYIHDAVGYNYRLTNLQAAVGVAQLENLPEYIARRQSNYLCYQNEIENIAGLTLAAQPGYANNNSWMYALVVDKSKFGMNRHELMRKLADYKIQSRPLWHPNHLQKPYEHCQTFKVDATVKRWQQTLNIPCSADLTIEQIEYVVEVLKNA